MKKEHWDEGIDAEYNETGEDEGLAWQVQPLYIKCLKAISVTKRGKKRIDFTRRIVL